MSDEYDYPETMRQVAPYPVILAKLVEKLKYRPGWYFTLDDLDRGQGSEGLTFSVYGRFPDTYEPSKILHVVHYFPVPPAAFNEESWKRWILERLRELESHEACEYFVLDEDGKDTRPFAPQHGPGNDPYIIWQQGDDLERRTRFDGTVADS